MPVWTRPPNDFRPIAPLVAARFDQPPFVPLGAQSERDEQELRALLIAIVDQRMPWELRYNGLIE